MRMPKSRCAHDNNSKGPRETQHGPLNRLRWQRLPESSLGARCDHVSKAFLAQSQVRMAGPRKEQTSQVGLSLQTAWVVSRRAGSVGACSSISVCTPTAEEQCSGPAPRCGGRVAIECRSSSVQECSNVDLSLEVRRDFLDPTWNKASATQKTAKVVDRS